MHGRFRPEWVAGLSRNLQLKQATDIPTLFKVIKNWSKYSKSFKVVGFTEDSVINKLTGLASGYRVIPKDIKNILIQYCKSTDTNVQKIAMQCMEGKWNQANLPTLEKIRCKSNRPQMLKLQAMVEKKSKGALTLAKKYRNDRDPYVRNTAIEALGEIGGRNELGWLNSQVNISLKTGIDKYDPAKIVEATVKIKERLGISIHKKN